MRMVQRTVERMLALGAGALFIFLSRSCFLSMSPVAVMAHSPFCLWHLFDITLRHDSTRRKKNASFSVLLVQCPEYRLQRNLQDLTGGQFSSE